MYQHSGVPGSVSIRFLHCPIEDFSVLENSSLISLIAEFQRVLNDEPMRNMYVHCMGGHGRTGTVMISLLAAVEGNDARSSTTVVAGMQVAEDAMDCD